MKKVLAVCKKTYPDENDMIDCYDGKIKPCDVKIYHKGRKYLVYPDHCDKEYYTVIKTLNPIK